VTSTAAFFSVVHVAEIMHENPFDFAAESALLGSLEEI
jgi:hypothetical protein